jgi:hypothetical protein
LTLRREDLVRAVGVTACLAKCEVSVDRLEFHIVTSTVGVVSIIGFHEQFVVAIGT